MQSGEQIDGVIGFDDEGRRHVVQGDFLDGNAKWIQVGVNAGDADGIPFQQILAHGAIHGAKSVEPSVAPERNFRQLTRRGAQLNPAVETELAAGNEEIQFGFEIRIQRAKIKPVQIKLDVGGRWRERRRPLRF